MILRANCLLWLLFYFVVGWSQTKPRLVLPIGHKGSVQSAVFSPDGKLALTASLDNTARIYDVSSGREVHVLSGHTESVISAVFSPDGKWALTASDDNTARIYDVSSGQEVHVLSGHTESVISAVFSPDGKYALTASVDHTARIYEVSSGREVRVLVGHTSWVDSAVFSSDGKWVLTASWDHTARIYDVSSGRAVHVLSGHTARVTSAVFSSNGKYALTASQDGTARIYDVSSGREVHVLSGHTNVLNSAEFSSDGKWALTASADTTARIYDLSTGREAHVLQGHTDKLWSAVFSSDGNYALTASEDGTARIYNVSSGRVVHVLSGQEERVYSAVFSSDGKYALTASIDGTAWIYDVSSGREVHVLSGHTGAVYSAVFSSDGKYALTASSDGTAGIYEVSSGREVRVLSGHTGSVYSAVFSSDGKWALTASEDSTARIYDVSNGKTVHLLAEHAGIVHSAEFSSDGKWALTASYDGTARIYDVSSGKEIHLLNGYTSFIYSAVFSPDGKWALTASRDNTARIYEVSTGREVHVLLGHAGEINSAVFSSDNKYILTTGADHKTILWDAATGKALYTRLQLKGNDWLVYDEHYRFDGTLGAIEKLYFVCGLEIVELNQFRKLLYVPHLVERILNGENLDHIAKLSQLQVCDHIPLVTPVDDNSKKYRFEITPRLSGVGDIEIYINGIKRGETIDANDLQLVNGRYYIEVDSLLIQEFTSPGEPAKIEVIAKTANNDINSRPAQMNTRSVQVSIAGQKENKLRKPELYAVLIGVDDYRDDALDLKFASKDAIDFHRAFQLAAEKYFNTDDTNRVHIFNLTIDRNGNTGSEKLNGMTPDKGTILRQLDEIEKKSKPADVILFFFAGHGKIVSNNELLLLTTESQAIEPIGVGIDELFERFSKIKASKRILILDACHAGVAINQLNQFGLIGMRADDDVATRSMHEKELDKLASKEGFSILTACSSSQEAQELPQYEHGLMTFALLNSMLNNPKSLTETGELNLGQWFSQVEEEIKRLNIPDQDVQVSLPVVFNIGKVDEEVRTTIQLKELPTVFIESVMNMKMMRDNLELKKRLNTCLQNTLRGEHTSVLVADSPQATRVNIGYEEQVENVKVNVLVYKGAIERSFEFNGSKAAMDHLANEIIARVLQELENE